MIKNLLIPFVLLLVSELAFGQKITSDSAFSKLTVNQLDSLKKIAKISRQALNTQLASNRLKELELNQRKDTIHSVSFRHLELATLPEITYECTSLRNLYLSESSFDFGNIDGERLSHIKHLDISDCDLKQIPDFVFDLDSLESLIISGNQIVRLPKQLKNLENLKEVSLSYSLVPIERLRAKKNKYITSLSLHENH